MDEGCMFELQSLPGALREMEIVLLKHMEPRCYWQIFTVFCSNTYSISTDS